MREGQYVLTPAPWAAYRWAKHLDWPEDKRVLVWVPMQAAVAGGCAHCIDLVRQAGWNLGKTWDWLKRQPLNISRAEVAITTLEVCLRRRTLEHRASSVQEWLRAAERWIRWRPGRKNCSEYEWGRLVQLYRRLYRTAGDYEAKLEIPDDARAELL
jgi:hypothetical protein